MRRRLRAPVALVSLIVVVGVTLTSATRSVPRASAATNTTTGVTRRTVTVAGIVGADAASAGADVGAQARFARANRSGGVAGRTIQYSGNATDAASVASSAFAMVPAAGDTLDPQSLASAGMPFVGSAATPAWEGNRFGFGFVGAQAVLQTRVVSPAWGSLLRSLLGTAQGSQVAVAADDDELGTARAEQARISLRAAGFRVAPAIRVPVPPAPPPDLAVTAGTLATGGPAVILLLTSTTTTASLVPQLVQLGFTGTVATDSSAYQPTAPAVASGLTVLVPYAPFEQSTAANRRLAADVEAFAPGTKLTPGIAAGYWSADLFLSMLAKTGTRLTRERFLAVARRFAHEVPATVGRVTFPAMHAQAVPCGALVQSDGSQYLVVERYRCGAPLVQKAKARGASTSS